VDVIVHRDGLVLLRQGAVSAVGGHEQPTCLEDGLFRTGDAEVRVFNQPGEQVFQAPLSVAAELVAGLGHGVGKGVRALECFAGAADELFELAQGAEAH
jgi:hypothetical protein